MRPKTPVTTASTTRPITTIGLANCFLIDAVSYIAVIGALLAMRTKDLHGREARTSRERGSVREGFHYVWTTPELRRPLVLMTIVFTFAFNWAVLLPLLAKRTATPPRSASCLRSRGLGRSPRP